MTGDADISNPLANQPVALAATGKRAWLQRAADALRSLTGNDSTFLLALLLLNALFRPYRGIEHDSVLYSFQVANHISDGRFADDLYFRYGSQDRYSIFSFVIVPVARVAGIPLAFFLFYLVWKPLFFWALLRLVRALIAERLLAGLALIYLAITPIPFAGLGIFFLNEDFLTPRLIATTLVLFGLEWMLAGRLWGAFVLLLAALPVHGPMALVGVLVFLGWWLAGRLKTVPLTCVLLGLSGLAAAVLLHTETGLRLFGLMDDDWREAVRRALFVVFPEDWQFHEWAHIIAAAAIAVGAVWCLADDPTRRRFVVVVLIVGLGGLAGGELACYLPYALLLQGQPWRALWLLELVGVPLGFFLMWRGWIAGGFAGRFTATALVLYFGVSAHAPGEAVSALLAIPPLVIVWRGLGRLPHQRDWLPLSAASGLCVGQLLRWVIGGVDVLILAIVAAGILLLAHRWLGAGRSFRIAAGLTWLAVQIACFIYYETTWFRAPDPGVEFVRSFVQTHWQGRTETPTVYWPGAHAKTVWFDLNANSYFDWHSQTAGIVFSKGEATEAMRRVEIVKRFQMDWLRRRDEVWHVDPYKRFMERLHRAEMFCTSSPGSRAPADPPTAEDLLRLCAQEKVDFVVLPVAFDGLYAATNGTWFLYDCEEVRARPPSGMPGPAASP